MRNTLTILICVCASFFLSAQVNVPPPDPNGPALTFDHLTFKFDTLIQGDTVIHEFRFTNTGKSPLIITDVTSSCGCVCPTYSKEPVAPGKTGVVRMDFRTAGKFGMQDKTLGEIECQEW